MKYKGHNRSLLKYVRMQQNMKTYTQMLFISLAVPFVGRSGKEETRKRSRELLFSWGLSGQFKIIKTTKQFLKLFITVKKHSIIISSAIIFFK